jgi:hypothetical protein
MNRLSIQWKCLAVGALLALQNIVAAPVVLKPVNFVHYPERFNAMEDENVTNTIPNAAAWAWMQEQIPFFECPNPEMEELYYFRWWSYRKHLVQTTNGWVITEFLPPVRHAGVNNTISCAVGFHLAEGRWLHDPVYLDDDTRFWLRGNAGHAQPHLHKFSGWLAAAVYERYAVTGDRLWVTGLLPDLVADFRAWETERQATFLAIRCQGWHGRINQRFADKSKFAADYQQLSICECAGDCPDCATGRRQIVGG